MSKGGLVVVAALLLGALPVHAQTTVDTLRPDAPVIRFDTMVVAATTPFITRGGASALHVRPDSMRLGPALTIERVVRELPFVQVRSNARGEAYFALRGSSFDSREVAVLVDGLPLSLGFDHRADLAVLPATGALALTMVRGIPALLYGPNVLGGVVELTLTEANRAGPPIRMSGGYDHTGGYAFSGHSAIASNIGSGTLVLRAGAGYRESEGFPLPSAITEPAPYSDVDTRLNSDRLQRDAFLSGRLTTGRGAWMSWSGFGYSSGRGTPAELNTTAARFWRYPQTRRVLGMVSSGTGTRVTPWGGSARVEGSIGHDVGHIELNGYTDRSYATVRDREVDDDRAVTARALAVQTIGKVGEMSFGGTYADIRRDEELSGNFLRYQQQLHSAAMETGWRLGAVRVHGGVAFDGARTPKSGDKAPVSPMDTWGARAGFTALPSDRIHIHGGVGRRARFPSLRELYSGALRMFEPNPDLRPEVLLASEVGATLQAGWAQVQAVAFHHRIEDAIVRTTTATRRVKRVNRDQMVSAGLELMAVFALNRTSVSVDLTMQDVQASDPTTDHEFRAEYQPKFAGGLRLGTPMFLNTHLDVAARGIGSQYCLDNSGNYTRLASSARSDVQLSRRFASLEVGLAVDNVLDAAIFDQCGLPQPGRLFRLRVALR